MTIGLRDIYGVRQTSVFSGGTKGQVLVKQSAVDDDADWENLSGLFHHGTADPVDTMGQDGDLYYKVDLTTQDREVKASFIKSGGKWLPLIAETPKVPKRVLFTPKGGTVFAPHADFVTTLILSEADAPEFFTEASSKPETIFLSDEDGNDLPFEIEGIDADKAVFHAKVRDLQKAIEIKSNGVTVNTNAGVTGTPAAQAVWGPEYLLVSHMTQRGNDPCLDSTSHANHGKWISGTTIDEATVIPNVFGIRFDDAKTNGYRFDNIPEYEVAGEFTVIFLAVQDSASWGAFLSSFAPDNCDRYYDYNWRLQMAGSYILPRKNDAPSVPMTQPGPGAAIKPVYGAPFEYAITRDSNDEIQGHHGTVHSDSIVRAGALDFTLSGQKSNIYLGGNIKNSSVSGIWNGEMYEFRYLKKRISDKEIELTFAALQGNLYDITVS